jgi:AraC family transcriptional regulator
VCLVTSGTLGIRVRSAGGNGTFLAPAGTALIFPSGFREARFCYDDSELICVELDPLRAARFFGQGGPANDALTPQFCLKDAHINALLTSMAAEVAEGCPTGVLYGESLSLSLAAYLEGRFGANKAERKHVRRGFSEPQVRQLNDYIRANLACDLDLLHLADVVDMSPRQFFRMFASTFASTPHRYITNERVIRAKALLSAGLSLAEIAQTLGFASQSHFGDVFRKVTGESPGRFRQQSYGSFPPRRRLHASKR